VIHLALAFAGSVLLLPVFGLIAMAVLIDSGRPVLFRQTRVGRGGTHFCMLKFRSMRSATQGPLITYTGDSRITRVGSFLRKYKLDELPQLWNVLAGDMDLVGPRPEVPCFVDLASPAWQSVLSARPGITDFASLVFRKEEEVLAGSGQPERTYREQILPAKLALNRDYLSRQSTRLDLKLILMTVLYSLAPGWFDAAGIRQRLGIEPALQACPALHHDFHAECD
jgi:lipopolysaccharide/colanic/teichoic acid biosynthesis glycosyltransferase